MPTRSAGKRLIAFGITVALLLIGMASGIAVDRVLLGARVEDVHGPARHQPKAILDRMQKELGLSPEQRQAITPIVETRSRAMGELFERIDPEVQEILRRTDAQIKALLDPEQQVLFQKKIDELQARRGAMRREIESARAQGK